MQRVEDRPCRQRRRVALAVKHGAQIGQKLLFWPALVLSVRVDVHACRPRPAGTGPLSAGHVTNSQQYLPRIPGSIMQDVGEGNG